MCFLARLLFSRGRRSLFPVESQLEYLLSLELTLPLLLLRRSVLFSLIFLGVGRGLRDNIEACWGGGGWEGGKLWEEKEEAGKEGEFGRMILDLGEVGEFRGDKEIANQITLVDIWEETLP